jgi:hypothetical protein
MTKTGPRTGTVVAGIATGATLCLASAMTVVAIATVVVMLSGLADETRATLRFGFGGVEHSPAEVGRIALYNARVAGGTLLCAVVAPRVEMRVRRLLFVLLATVLTCSAAAVGVAIGAYGDRAIAAIAVHLPVEFSALSVAGGAYMQACKQALHARELAATGATTGLLLVVAAALETYVSIGGTQ